MEINIKGHNFGAMDCVVSTDNAAFVECFTSNDKKEKRNLAEQFMNAAFEICDNDTWIEIVTEYLDADDLSEIANRVKSGLLKEQMEKEKS